MTATSARRALEEAFRRAILTSRPAHVSLPLDVQRAPVAPFAAGYRACAKVAAAPDGDSIGKAADVLGKAPRSALLVGRGARGAEAELVALAERLGAPVVTTVSGKGLFPEHHELSAGVFSFAAGPLARHLMTSRLDALCAIGTGLGEFATMNYSDGIRPAGNLVHVDRDPSVLGRNYPCLPVCGDSKLALSALLSALGLRPERVQVPEWFSAMQRERQRYQRPLALTSDRNPIAPERVIRELERVLPNDACVVADIGTSCAFVAHCLRLAPPQRAYIPMAWSCMGHPLGASIGVRLGSGRPTFTVTGDGAFLAKGAELHAAVEAGLGRFVWIVLSNGGHGLVRMGTEAALGKAHGGEVGTFRQAPDIAGIARALGAVAETVDDVRDLARVLRGAAVSDRPYVVDVRVDPAACPPMEDRIQVLNPECDLGAGPTPQPETRGPMG